MIEYDEERKPKKKKRKSQATSPWLVYGIVAGVLLLVVVIVVVVVINVPRPGNDVQAQGNAPPGQQPPVQQPGAQQQPGAGDGGGRIKPNPNPKGLVQNIRATALRVDRQNEMKNIGVFFNAYVSEFGKGPRTEDDFFQYIKRDLPRVVEAFKEKYYVLNVKAKVGGPGVIAYEDLLDAGRHLVVRTDGSVDLILPDELQKLLKE